MEIQKLLQAIAVGKIRLEELRPLSPEALGKLEHYYDIELTWSSNAIEGNTLSPVETTLVIEQGVTIGGKPLKDHLEAIDHYDAIRYVRELAKDRSAPVSGMWLRGSEPHRRLLSKRIAVWWTSIRSTTATGGRRGCS